MKCKNCGNDLTMLEKFCSNCGSRNEEAWKHISDMDMYEQQFSRTQKEVVNNSKWFIKYMAPLVTLAVTVVVSVIVFAHAIEGYGYDLAQNENEKYIKRHSTEVKSQLKTMLDNGDYTAFTMAHSKGYRTLSDTKYSPEWQKFYNVSESYINIRNSITQYLYMPSSGYSYSSSIDRAAKSIYDAYYNLNNGYSNPDPDSIEPLKEVVEEMELFLKVYCKFTDEDIKTIQTKDVNYITSLLSRRLTDEE